MKKISLNIISSIILLIICGCSFTTYDKVYPTLQDGKYDSEFPYTSTSVELSKISETIQRVNSTAFYKIFVFDSKDNFTLKDLANKDLNKIAVKEALADTEMLHY